MSPRWRFILAVTLLVPCIASAGSDTGKSAAGEVGGSEKAAKTTAKKGLRAHRTVRKAAAGGPAVEPAPLPDKKAELRMRHADADRVLQAQEAAAIENIDADKSLKVAQRESAIKDARKYFQERRARADERFQRRLEALEASGS